MKRSKTDMKVIKEWSVILSLCLGIFLFLALPFALREYVVQAFKIPAASMLPTLEIGDHILVKKKTGTHRNIKRGDIIVFKYPQDEEKDFVKRVVGLPGERIEIKNRQVFVQEQELKEEYVIFTDYDHEIEPRDNFGPIVVPSGSYFVLGDNRDRSMDSRYFGSVEQSKIVGKVWRIYWSWDQESKSVRWDRIGMPVD